MNQAQYSRLFSFLFNIANDVLVQAFEGIKEQMDT